MRFFQHTLSLLGSLTKKNHTYSDPEIVVAKSYLQTWKYSDLIKFDRQKPTGIEGGGLMFTPKSVYDTSVKND